MNRKDDYADLEKWKNTCNKQNRRYYKKTAIYDNRTRYTAKECEMILKHDIPDTELSKIIHRSVMSIQVKRSKLR